ncbi:hypothetical protein [Actinoplanes regularis]|uniref:hypothetical protein n=1 Tax=Actinoplanes regularis TaxID=52697 RepID=UPI00255717B9|nr:hypothetical protein [Actinoplanes regularis]GLW27684.1 hypothetical protein Areg01_06240 [Actinoplanes regularis]
MINLAGGNPDPATLPSLAEATSGCEPVLYGARAVICTPRAHNPTGASLTTGRAARLRAVLAAYPEVLVAVRGGRDFAVGSRPAPAIRVTTSTITAAQATAFAADPAALW